MVLVCVWILMYVYIRVRMTRVCNAVFVCVTCACDTCVHDMRVTRVCVCVTLRVGVALCTTVTLPTHTHACHTRVPGVPWGSCGALWVSMGRCGMMWVGMEQLWGSYGALWGSYGAL